MVNSQYMSAVIIHVLINSTRFSIITHIRVSLFFFPPEYLCSLIDSKFYKEKIFFFYFVYCLAPRSKHSAEDMEGT